MYTGERILSGGIFNVTFQQSKKAYEFVAELAKQKTILDVACGEGYGIAMLGSVARRAIGADRDKTAIAQASQKYHMPNITFIQADLFELPGTLTEKFDIVCCFQTIEHITDHDAFMAILKKLVTPDGKIVVSTPNKRRFPTFNPYHVHELDYSQLRQLCQRHFTSFDIFGVQASPAVIQYRTTKEAIGQKLLRFDFLDLRHRLPRPIVQALYSFVSFYIVKRISWWRHRKQALKITGADFSVSTSNVPQALDFIVVAEV